MLRRVSKLWSDETMDTIPSNTVSPAQSHGAYPTTPRSHFVLHYLFQLLIPAAIILFIGISLVTAYLEKFLWMVQLRYTGVFWTLFSVQWAMFAVAFVIAFLFIWVNLRQALLNSGATTRAVDHAAGNNCFFNRAVTAPLRPIRT
jgi:hypothetical protein